MSSIQNRLLILLLMAVLIFTGCSLFEYESKIDTLQNIVPGSEQIVNRDLTSSQAFAYADASFKLKLEADSLNENSHISIYKIPVYMQDFPWLSQFNRISSYYRITITPPLETLQHQASVTFTLPPGPAKTGYFAINRNGTTWELHSPSGISIPGELSFSLLNFSELLLVEQLSDFSEALNAPLALIASPALLVALSLIHI